MEIVVLAVSQFGADTDDDSFTDIGTDIRNAHHVGQEVFEAGIQEDIALPAAHSAQMTLLKVRHQVCRDFAKGLDPVSSIDVAFFEGDLRIFQDLLQKGIQDAEFLVRSL